LTTFCFAISVLRFSTGAIVIVRNAAKSLCILRTLCSEFFLIFWLTLAPKRRLYMPSKLDKKRRTAKMVEF